MNERQYGGQARLAGTDHSPLTNDQKKTKHYLSIPILSCVLKYKCNKDDPLLEIAGMDSDLLRFRIDR